MVVDLEGWWIRMEMVDVESGMIGRVGHEGDILRVEFKNGDEWEYGGVSEKEYGEMMGYGSVGGWFSFYIKGNKTGKRVGNGGE